jgi:hypothetical protein
MADSNFVDERFEGYIESLQAGEIVTIAADDRHGDFLRYVDAKGGELRKEFEEHYERDFRNVGTEAVPPVVIDMWLENRRIKKDI